MPIKPSNVSPTSFSSVSEKSEPLQSDSIKTDEDWSSEGCHKSSNEKL